MAGGNQTGCYKTGRKKRLYPEDYPPCFESRLEQLVIDSELSQRQFAHQILTHEHNITYWIQGQRKPDLESFERICKYCHVSADWLLGFKEEREIGK